MNFCGRTFRWWNDVRLWQVTMSSKAGARVVVAAAIGVALALGVAAALVGVEIVEANREFVEVRAEAACAYTVWVTHAARWDRCVKPARSVISRTDFETLRVYWKAIGLEEPQGWRTACVWWACGDRGGLVRRGLGRVFLPEVLCTRAEGRPTPAAPTEPRPTPTVGRKFDELPVLEP